MMILDIHWIQIISIDIWYGEYTTSMVHCHSNNSLNNCHKQSVATCDPYQVFLKRLQKLIFSQIDHGKQTELTKKENE